MASKVGSLLADLGLNTANFQAGVKRAQTSFRKFKNAMKRQAREMKRAVGSLIGDLVRMGALLAVAVPAAMVAMAVSAAKAIDAQQKFADVIGTTQAELMGLQLAARELSGVTDTQLNMALQRMTRRIAEAAQGLGEGKQAIKDLGLDAKTLSEQDPAETFRDIADAIQDVPEQSERLRIAFKLFDSEGARLVTTLAAGSEELGNFKQLAEDMGLTLDRTAIAQIEAMNDALDLAKDVFGGFFNDLNVAASPILTKIANDFIMVRTEAENLSIGQIWVDNIVAAVGRLGDMAQWATIKMVELGASTLKISRLLPSSGILAPLKGMLQDGGIDDIIVQLDTMVNMLKLAPKPSEGIRGYIAAANEEMEAAVAQYHEMTLDVNAAGAAAAASQRDIFDEMGNAIAGNYENAMDAVLGVFRKTLQTMIGEALASNIRNVFTSAAGESGGGGGFLSKLLSFDGGGGTGSGSRSGGVDGKGGFLSILHPKETVIDHTKGQGTGGVSITQYNDFSGSSSVDQSQIRTLLKQNSDQTVAMVQNLIARQRFG